MQYAVSILLSGISVGGQYALIAIGYTMVYGILRLINFAHGDVFMTAGLMLVYMSASLPLGVAIPLMIVATVVLGFFIERAAYKPLRSAPRMSIMISAIGVSFLIQNFATYYTGGLPLFYLQGGWAPRKVGWLKRRMVGMATRSTRKALQQKARRTPQEEQGLNFLIRGGSYVAYENLAPIQSWLREHQ